MCNKKPPPQGAADAGILTVDQPFIILPAVYDVIHIDGIFPDLVEHKIPVIHKHFAVLIGWYICFLKAGKPGRHGLQRAEGI
jgi:hypothetical protein